MLRKLMLTAAVVAGVMFAMSGTVDAGHGHRGGHHHHRHNGYGWNGGFRGVYVAPRYVAPPVYGYPVYGDPYCDHGYGYGYGGGYGYQPYGQAFGIRTGNFSLFLGR